MTRDAGEKAKGSIRPEFNRSVVIDFNGAKITSDVGVLMLREVDALRNHRPHGRQGPRPADGAAAFHHNPAMSGWQRGSRYHAPNGLLKLCCKVAAFPKTP